MFFSLHLMAVSLPFLSFMNHVNTFNASYKIAPGLLRIRPYNFKHTLILNFIDFLYTSIVPKKENVLVSSYASSPKSILSCAPSSISAG